MPSSGRSSPKSPKSPIRRRSSSRAKLLKSGDVAARVSAAEALGALGPAAAPQAGALTLALKDESSEVRTAAIDALAAIGGTVARTQAPAIAGLLHDDCAVVRAAAAEALGTMDQTGAAFVVPMAELLRDPQKKVQVLALDALLQLPGAGCAMEPHIHSLMKILYYDDWQARRAALESLGKLKVETAAQRLSCIVEMMKDDNSNVRCEAVRTLGVLGERMGHDAAMVHYPAVAKLLCDMDRRVRKAALRTLGEHSPPYVEAIADDLRDLHESEVGNGMTAVEALLDFGKLSIQPLMKLLSEGSESARRLACRCLCKLREVSMILRHNDVQVRLLALRILAEMGEVAVENTDVIIESLFDSNANLRHAAVHTLSIIGDPVLQRILHLLEDERVFVRHAAIDILGRMARDAIRSVDDSLSQHGPAGMSWRPVPLAAVECIAQAISALLWDRDGDARAIAEASLECMGEHGAAKLAAARATPCIDITCSKSFEHDLLKMAAERLDWGISNATGGAVAWVHGKENMIERLLMLRGGEYLSHIPALGTLTLKVPLADMLQACGAEFWPRSWCVPEAPVENFWSGLRHGRPMTGQSVEVVMQEVFAAGPKTVIIKPSAGSQGKGIVLARCREEMASALDEIPGKAAIVQEYVDRPLLLGGHKWDVRVYVLLVPEIRHATETGSKNFATADLGSMGLLCFLAHEGLVRVCVDPYEQAHSRNLHRATAHLTNYSLSKLSEKFEHSEDPNNPDFGTKRKLSAVLRRLEGGSDIRSETFEDADGNQGTYSGAFDSKGNPHGLGMVCYADGRTFVGQFSDGKLHKGATYDDCGLPVCTMESGRRTLLVDDEIAVEFPLSLKSTWQIQETGVGTSKFNTQAFWKSLGNIARRTADALTHTLFSIALDSKFWNNSDKDCNADLVPLVRKALPNCFHIIGLDVLVAEDGKLWLLEVNSAPSFDIGEVVVREDLKQQSIGEQNQVFAALTQELRGPKEGRLCRCSALPRPHAHEISPIDVAVKLPVISDAFRIIGRSRSNFPGGPTSWAEGTVYEVV